ncbi:MAG: type I-E CRISPR-associated endoribonuclease Cas2 [Candidatus Methanomethylophilaceae archaeon]|nr:type I-E CRISPR-associated endoribonuclease Cas2 [Candidatus Methanomethylophilaceae archaeon]
MIVVVLSSCSPSLRGDLTKWLFEISTNVYAGQTGARIREKLWERIVSECGETGRASLVYTTNNEQGFDFLVHNSDRVPYEIDGIRFLLKPSKNENRMRF